ncbi:sulfite exporter TauE/SafE family protein [Rickettsiella massiliensis]|uniref:sulfite exporter TauE/SafE family protein n=1 Tax=Rickettsiella massiliensis TaxID=676517 RepID=UPI00029AC888|nr:sulfite exporter TauE/SafE family protein [Rickettsiella massiliensis]
MHLATSTALASIIFSALIAVFYQQRRGAIHWPIFGQLMPGMLLGLLGGAFLSLRLSTETLKILFSLFLWAMALKLFMYKKDEKLHKNEHPLLIVQWVMGAFIGLISGLLGIGGGAVAVPILLRLGFTFLFTLTSLHLSGLPEGIHSFVYWPAVFGLVLGSLLCVPLGVRLGQRLSGSKLRKCSLFFF